MLGARVRGKLGARVVQHDMITIQLGARVVQHDTAVALKIIQLGARVVQHDMITIL